MGDSSISTARAAVPISTVKGREEGCVGHSRVNTARAAVEISTVKGLMMREEGCAQVI